MTRNSINRFVQSVLAAQHAIGAMNSALHTDLLETQIYIGLNDAKTRKQEYETESYVSILKQVCVAHGVPFSFDVINGGYIHDDGEYTEEQTIVLTFIDIDQDVVDAIAKDLCERFNQEAVLITADSIKARTVRSTSAD